MYAIPLLVIHRSTDLPIKLYLPSLPTPFTHVDSPTYDSELTTTYSSTMAVVVLS
jgi:hypothetical protein